MRYTYVYLFFVENLKKLPPIPNMVKILYNYRKMSIFQTKMSIYFMDFL